MSQPESEESCASTEVNSATSRLHAELQAAGAHGTAISEKVQDILTVIPLNTEARRAFDTVAQSAKKGSLDALHAQYVCITGEQSLEHEAVDAGNETGETSEDETSTHRPTIILTGYYRLQFGLAAVSKTPTWVIGRGSGKKFGPTRNVDIILVAPGAKSIQGLAAAHMYLGIRTDSGAWRITAGAKMQVEDKSYHPGEVVHLCQPKTRIQILDMQYLIRFEISTDDLEAEYIKVRNKMLQKEGFTLPHTDISGIPFQGDMFFDSIVFRHGIGSGTFGSVYEGFGPETGELRVAKRIILHSAIQAPEVGREIQALQRFNGSVGILGLIDWRTSLNGKNLIVAKYPLDVYLIHDKAYKNKKRRVSGVLLIQYTAGEPSPPVSQRSRLLNKLDKEERTVRTEQRENRWWCIASAARVFVGKATQGLRRPILTAEGIGATVQSTESFPSINQKFSANENLRPEKTAKNNLLKGEVNISEALGYGIRHELVVIMRMGVMIKIMNYTHNQAQCMRHVTVPVECRSEPSTEDP
ncbi:MAG: hypothetical protein Q9176_008004 [Flavoplaca citrina]